MRTVVSALQRYTGRSVRSGNPMLTRLPDRPERLNAEATRLYLGYSRDRITDETFGLLRQLGDQSELEQSRPAIFSGSRSTCPRTIRSCTWLMRMHEETSLVVDGRNLVGEVHQVLDGMADLATKVRSEVRNGHTGKPMRDIISIRIGGSDLGPVLAFEALCYYTDRNLTFRFVSNVNSTDVAEATRDLPAEETLFIISSKGPVENPGAGHREPAGMLAGRNGR